MSIENGGEFPVGPEPNRSGDEFRFLSLPFRGLGDFRIPPTGLRNPYHSKEIDYERKSPEDAEDGLGPLFYQPGITSVHSFFDYLDSFQALIPKSPVYSNFPVQEDAERYFKLSKEIAAYAHAENIGSLMLIDKSARPAYVGFLRAWRKNYPDQPRPRINFVNPMGLQSIDGTSPEELYHTRRLAGRTNDSQIGFARPQKVVDAEFKNTFADIIAGKDRPVLVLDTCVHSGDSSQVVVDQLRKNGVTDVRFGVTSYEPRIPLQTEPDVIFDGESLAAGCYPFGYGDFIVVKSFESVTSDASRDPEQVAKARVLRREAGRIVSEGFRNQA